ncbi:nitrous oxide reductase accessory protein NosL [Paenibacillus xylaniclasticus]|uniref:nitrous oxide reductase accessory protein NosL n=1 Tax=Paenibacillus xylaniclasticus TaxID=588083 RepID=UPI000FD83140|nr:MULTISPECIES: nitrous oxide reductase accessory protein NosL [Paenibacillus]GFN32303.1 hypothetical protein PCURB6_25630 [Paenibacillus curdlanolyticus]
MKKTWKSMLVIQCLLIALLLMTGCGESKYKAVAINEETDKCDNCNMQVKDDAFATQLTTKEGKTYVFDDIGCMNEWLTKHSDEKIGASFVRDYNNSEWIKYEDAYYAYDPSFRSPMAYGILSFKDKESAEQFVKSQNKGIVMTSEELANHSWARNTEMMHGMMEMGQEHDEQAHSESAATMHMDKSDEGKVHN